MRKRWSLTLTFLAGVLVGGAAAASFVGWHWERNFRDWYVLQLADQANVAKEIYSGKAPELADRLRSSLPVYVNVVESHFPNTEGKYWAYWVVDDVYRVSGVKPPQELQGLLASLPPRPKCQRPPAKM